MNDLHDTNYGHEHNVVFVTHDIDEALYLSDRVLVLGGKPGGIVEETTVDAARPRDRRSPYLRDDITSDISVM